MDILKSVVNAFRRKPSFGAPVFISDKDTAKLYVQFCRPKSTPNLNISVRMSWSISEILESFKNSQSVLSGLKHDYRNCSFFKQYIKILNKYAILLDVFTGCFESFKNERFSTRDFTITASSELSSHKAFYSRLYGTDGWCSSSASLPQYLQADFGQIVIVTGVATQGDNKRDNRVTSYLIRYGYDGKTWISYGAGQVNLQHVFIYLSGFA